MGYAPWTNQRTPPPCFYLFLACTWCSYLLLLTLFKLCIYKFRIETFSLQIFPENLYHCLLGRLLCTDGSFHRGTNSSSLGLFHIGKLATRGRLSHTPWSLSSCLHMPENPCFNWEFPTHLFDRIQSRLGSYLLCKLKTYYPYHILVGLHELELALIYQMTYLCQSRSSFWS